MVHARVLVVLVVELGVSVVVLVVLEVLWMFCWLQGISLIVLCGSYGSSGGLRRFRMFLWWY